MAVANPSPSEHLTTDEPTQAAPFSLAAPPDHFTLFGLPVRFAQSRPALDKAWRALQAQVHPDRHATGSAVERRLALQWASHINAAYQVLRQPLSRARYLCELAGLDVGAENNTAMAPAFLMQQMAWREALEAAGSDAARRASVIAELEAARDACRAAVTEAFDVAAQPADAVPKVREWMFIERMLEQTAT